MLVEVLILCDVDFLKHVRIPDVQDRLKVIANSINLRYLFAEIFFKDMNPRVLVIIVLLHYFIIS